MGAATQPPPSLSGYAKLTDLPQPAGAVPPPEVVGGAPGSALTYRRSDAVQPRITRSTTLTLDVNGTATFDWTAQGALNGPVQVALTPVYTGASVPTCYATAVSTTAVSIKCMLMSTSNITLALVTAGLNLFGGSAAGMSVGVIALPKS